MTSVRWATTFCQLHFGVCFFMSFGVICYLTLKCWQSEASLKCCSENTLDNEWIHENELRTCCQQYGLLVLLGFAVNILHLLWMARSVTSQVDFVKVVWKYFFSDVKTTLWSSTISSHSFLTFAFEDHDVTRSLTVASFILLWMTIHR